MIFSTMGKLLLASSSLAAVIQICLSVGIFSRALFKTYTHINTRHKSYNAQHYSYILKKSNFLNPLSVAYLPCIFVRLQSSKSEPKLQRKQKQESYFQFSLENTIRETDGVSEAGNNSCQFAGHWVGKGLHLTRQSQSGPTKHNFHIGSQVLCQTVISEKQKRISKSHSESMRTDFRATGPLISADSHPMTACCLHSWLSNVTF